MGAVVGLVQNDDLKTYKKQILKDLAVEYNRSILRIKKQIFVPQGYRKI